ncbi:MAG: hypothetical protein ACRD2N_24540 [Vicinamibacterales bacterium]
MHAQATADRASPGWLTWLVIGALVAGALDIIYAIVFSYFRSGVAPSRILQSVASGALGRAAYDGGAQTAALGLGFHFLNAFITTIFFLAARAMPRLVQKPIAIGAAYGVVVYLAMNYVVIPLSAIGVFPRPAMVVWVSGVLVHMFLIGVPIALAARGAFGRTG